MHRVDTAGSVSGMWSGGNPGLGLAPTEFGKDWFNDSQENLIAVLTAAGISPVKLTFTQLRDAIFALITAGGPPASTTVAGLIALATLAEVLAGVVTNKAVTPATLAGLVASTTQSGILKLASNAVTLAGVDAATAVTPAGLASFPGSLGPSGYKQLPGGLILQWCWTGIGTSPSGQVTVSLPMTFPNACFGPLGSPVVDGASSTPGEIHCGVDSFSTSSATFGFFRISGSGTDTMKVFGFFLGN